MSKKEKFLDKQTYVHWLFDVFPDDSIGGATMIDSLINMKKYVLDEELFETIFDLCYKKHSRELQKRIKENVCESIEIYNRVNSENFQLFYRIKEKVNSTVTSVYDRRTYAHKYDCYKLTDEIFTQMISEIDNFDIFKKNGEFRETFLYPIGVQCMNEDQESTGGHAIGTFFKKIKEGPITNPNDDDYVFYVTNAGAGSEYQFNLDSQEENYGIVGIKTSLNKLKIIYTLLFGTSTSKTDLKKPKDFDEFMQSQLTLDEFYYFVFKILLSDKHDLREILNEELPSTYINESPKLYDYTIVPLQLIGNCTFNAIFYSFDLIFKKMIDSCENQLTRESKEFYNSGKVALFEMFASEILELTDLKEKTSLLIKMNETYQLLVRDGAYDINEFTKGKKSEHYELCKEMNNRLINYVETANAIKDVKPKEDSSYLDEVKEFCINSGFSFNLKEPNKNTPLVLKNIAEKLEETIAFLKAEKFKVEKLVIYLHLLYNCVSYITMIRNRFEDFVLPRFYQNEVRELLKKFINLVENDGNLIATFKANFEHYETRICILLKKITAGLISLNNDYQESYKNVGQQSITGKYYTIFELSITELVIFTGLLFEKLTNEKCEEYENAEELVDDMLKKTILILPSDLEYLCYMKELMIEYSRFLIFSRNSFSFTPSIPTETFHATTYGESNLPSMFGQYLIKGSTYEHKQCISKMNVFVREKAKKVKRTDPDEKSYCSYPRGNLSIIHFYNILHKDLKDIKSLTHFGTTYNFHISKNTLNWTLLKMNLFNNETITGPTFETNDEPMCGDNYMCLDLLYNTTSYNSANLNNINNILISQQNSLFKEETFELHSQNQQVDEFTPISANLYYLYFDKNYISKKSTNLTYMYRTQNFIINKTILNTEVIIEILEKIKKLLVNNELSYKTYNRYASIVIDLIYISRQLYLHLDSTFYSRLILLAREINDYLENVYINFLTNSYDNEAAIPFTELFKYVDNNIKKFKSGAIGIKVTEEDETSPPPGPSIGLSATPSVPSLSRTASGPPAPMRRSDSISSYSAGIPLPPPKRTAEELEDAKYLGERFCLTFVPQLFKYIDQYKRYLRETSSFYTFYGNDFGTYSSYVYRIFKKSKYIFGLSNGKIKFMIPSSTELNFEFNPYKIDLSWDSLPESFNPTPEEISDKDLYKSPTIDDISQIMYELEDLYSDGAPGGGLAAESTPGPGMLLPSANLGHGKTIPGVDPSSLPEFNEQGDLRIINLGNITFTFYKIHKKFKYYVYYKLANVQIDDFIILKKYKKSFDYKYSFVQFLFDTDYDLFNLSNFSSDENAFEYKGKKLEITFDDNKYNLTIDSKPVIRLIDLLTHSNDKVKDVYSKIFNFLHTNIDDVCFKSKCLKQNNGVIGPFYNDVIPYMDSDDVIVFWCPDLNVSFKYNLTTNQLYFKDSLIITERVDYLFNKYVYDTKLFLIKNENYEIIGLGKDGNSTPDSKIYNFTIPINGIFNEDKYEMLYLIKQNLNAGKYYDVDVLLCNLEVFSSNFTSLGEKISITFRNLKKSIYFYYYIRILYDFLDEEIAKIAIYDPNISNPEKKIQLIPPINPPVSIIKHYDFFKMNFMEHFGGARQKINYNISYPEEYKSYKKSLKTSMKNSRDVFIKDAYPITIENKLFFKRASGGDFGEVFKEQHYSLNLFFTTNEIWGVLFSKANCEYNLTKPKSYNYKSKIHKNVEKRYNFTIFEETDTYLLNDLNLTTRDNSLYKEELTIEDTKVIEDYNAFLDANKSIIIISKAKLEELNSRINEKINQFVSEINSSFKKETSEKYLNYSTINDNIYDIYKNDNDDNVIKINYIHKLMNIRLMINNELSHTRTDYNFTSIKKVIEQKPFYKDLPTIDSNVVIMEYIVKFLIRNNQQLFVDKLLGELTFKENCGIHQLLMGEGKSTVIAPLLTIKLQKENKAEKLDRDIIHCVPESLVKQSTLIFKNVFIYLDKVFFYNNVEIISDVKLKEKKLKSLLEGKEYYMQDQYYIFDEIDELADPLKSNLNIIYSKEQRLNNDRIIFEFIFDFVYKLYFDPDNDFLRERLHGVYNFSLKPHLNYSGEYKPGIESLIKPLFYEVINRYNVLYSTIIEKILTKTELDSSELSQIDMSLLSSMYNFYILIPTLLKNLDRRHFGFKHVTLSDKIIQDIVNGTELDETIPSGGRGWASYQPKKKKFHLSFKKHKKFFIAVPFLATEQPSEGSEFSDQLFTIAATIISYMNHDNFNNMRMKNIEVSIYLNKVLKEYLEYIDEPIEENEGALKYNKLVEGIQKKVVISSKLKFSTFNKKDINKMKKNLLKYLIRDYLIEILFDSLIRIYPTFDNISFLDLIVKDNSIRRIGFTGTPNMLVPYDYVDPLRDINNICRDIDKQPLGDGAIVASIVGLTTDKKAQEKIITNTEDIFPLLVSGKYHSLIDVGSLFLGVDQTIVSQTILEKFLASEDNYIQTVIFIDKANNKMGISKVDDKFVIKSFSEINTPLYNRFFYFDQGHITGIDFKIYPDAKGLITLSGNSRFRDVAQGIYRLRNINRGQYIDFCFTKITQSIIAGRPIVKFLFDKENSYRNGQEKEFYKQNIKAIYRNYVRKLFKETGEFIIDEDICETYAKHLAEGLNKQLNLMPIPETPGQITYDFSDYFMLESLDILKSKKIKNPKVSEIMLELVTKMKKAVKSDVEIDIAQERDEEQGREVELALEVDQDIDQDLEMDIQRMQPLDRSLPYNVDFKRIEEIDFSKYFDIDKFIGKDINEIAHDTSFNVRDDLRLEVCVFEEIFMNYTPYIYIIKKEYINNLGKKAYYEEIWVNILSKLLFIHLQDNIYIDALGFIMTKTGSTSTYSQVSNTSFKISFNCYIEVYDSDNNLKYYILTSLEQAIKVASEAKKNGIYNFRILTFPEAEPNSQSNTVKIPPPDKKYKDNLLKMLLNSKNLNNEEILSFFDKISPRMYQYRLLYSDRNYLINLGGYIKLDDLMNSMKIFKFLKDFGKKETDGYYSNEAKVVNFIVDAVDNLRNCTAIDIHKKQKYLDLFINQAFLSKYIPISINIFTKLFGSQVYVIQTLKTYSIPLIRNFWYCYNKYRKSEVASYEAEIIHNKDLIECNKPGEFVRVPLPALRPVPAAASKKPRNPLGGIIEELEDEEEEEEVLRTPGGGTPPGLSNGLRLPAPRY